MAEMNRRCSRSYASRHRLVFASRRQPIPTGFTVRDMARDYAWAIEQLGLGRTHLEANSAGGPVAQWLAVDRPDLVLPGAPRERPHG